jgi:hypothetical protein
MKNILTLMAATLIGNALSAQGAITGTIPNWSNGSGEVALVMMGPPKVLGTFDDQGRLEIPLPPDFLAQARQEVEEANASASGGWKASLPTLGDRYSCTGGDLEVTGGAQAISGFPAMGGFDLVSMEREERFGYLMAASSREFAEGMEPYKFKPGYFLEWHFVEEPASVKGTCSSEAYAMNVEELYTATMEYDLDFKKGWNIVKYEIMEVFTDREGNSYPMKEKYSVLGEMPADVQFIFLPE